MNSDKKQIAMVRRVLSVMEEARKQNEQYSWLIESLSPVDEAAPVTRIQEAPVIKNEAVKKTCGDRELTKLAEGVKNVVAYSRLLNEPSRKDGWFQVIDDMTRAFHIEHGAIPNEVQAWGRLWTNPPTGYEITTAADKGEDCLKMPGVSPLSRAAFAKRWAKYSANR